eukprot:PhF_6_TR27009/c0_g1_i1/m.39440/K18584/ACTR3, ARP3; actin-related protein 3
MSLPVIVLDNGTGFTKMGYAGNYEPSYVFPTAYADQDSVNRKPGILDDLDFYIGQEAIDRIGTHTVTYPMRHGIVEDWDKMERLWQHCIYKYLRCEPQEHGFLLTEPPLNPPENREYTAEIMFETFGVGKLYIAVQGVLALYASSQSSKAQKLGFDNALTGTVIDAGDGVTHVVPIVDGYVINSAIRHIPLAGRDVTNMVLQKLRNREGSSIPPEEALRTAQMIKEKYCYVCKDLASEFNAFDSDPSRFMRHTQTSQKSGKSFSFDVGYEQFLGPEVFFHPEIFNSEFTKPLPDVVDETIMATPIDCRRSLFKNIALSGGTTTFKDFHKRLQKDLRGIVDARIARWREDLIDKTKEISIDVNVINHDLQRYAVWCGGSHLASGPQFQELAHTKAEYDEHGPSICRYNVMFQSALKPKKR